MPFGTNDTIVDEIKPFGVNDEVISESDKERKIGLLKNIIKDLPGPAFAMFMALSKADPFGARSFLLRHVGKYITPKQPDLFPMLEEAASRIQSETPLTSWKKYPGIAGQVGKIASEFTVLPGVGGPVASAATKFALQPALQAPTATEEQQPLSTILGQRAVQAGESAVTGAALGGLGKITAPITESVAKQFGVTSPFAKKLLQTAIEAPPVAGGFMALTALEGGDKEQVLETGIQIVGFEALGLMQNGLFPEAAKKAVEFNPKLAEETTPEKLAGTLEKIAPGAVTSKKLTAGRLPAEQAAKMQETTVGDLKKNTSSVNVFVGKDTGHIYADESLKQRTDPVAKTTELFDPKTGEVMFPLKESSELIKQAQEIVRQKSSTLPQVENKGAITPTETNKAADVATAKPNEGQGNVHKLSDTELSQEYSKLPIKDSYVLQKQVDDLIDKHLENGMSFEQANEQPDVLATFRTRDIVDNYDLRLSTNTMVNEIDKVTNNTELSKEILDRAFDIKTNSSLGVYSAMDKLRSISEGHYEDVGKKIGDILIENYGKKNNLNMNLVLNTNLSGWTEKGKSDFIKEIAEKSRKIAKIYKGVVTGEIKPKLQLSPPVKENLTTEPAGKGEVKAGGQKTYTGPAYRVKTGTETKPNDKTAADVVRYEQDELGNNLGVSPEKLKELEQRPASDVVWVTKTRPEAKHYGKDISNYTNVVKGGEIISDIGPDGVLVLKPLAASKPRLISKSKAIKLGHQLPDVLGWEEPQRRDFLKQTTGKTSMKEMSLKEMRIVVEGLQAEVKKQGLETPELKLPTDDLIGALRQKKTTEMGPIEELHPGKWRKLVYDIKNAGYKFLMGHEKVERFLEGLDGKKNGVFFRTFWEPAAQKDNLANEFTGQDQKLLKTTLDELKVDVSELMGNPISVPGTRIKLTPDERIGVYMLSLNPKGLKNLTSGMGLTETDVTAINKSLTPQEKQVADFILTHFENQWPALKQAAAQAGYDLAKLKQEYSYAPIIRKDVNIELQPDFLNEIADQFITPGTQPESGMLKPRKPGAAGKLELSSMMMFFRNAARVNRFIQMAPYAREMSGILRNKEFRKTLNDKTYGQGTKIIENWLRDTVRGSITRDMSYIGKLVDLARRKNVLFALGHNILARSRQLLGTFNSMSVDPRMPGNMIKNFVEYSLPGGHKKLETFVYSRSLQMKNRDFERDIKAVFNKENAKKLLLGKELSPRSMRGIAQTDKYVAALAWKSFYDMGMKDLKGDELGAIKFADTWTRRTQSMASPKDLPEFFRGGSLEKLFTTFQTETATLGNYWAHDIIGAKTRGEIGWRMLSYRTLVGYVLPALLFGDINRGRLQQNGKEVAVDLVTYPVAPFIFLGNWIQRMITGLQTGVIGTAGFEGIISAVASARKLVNSENLSEAEYDKTIRSLIKAGAKTVGGFTGRITAQEIRTAEGAYDLMTGQTEDYRRLIWSKGALEQGRKKEQEPNF